MHDHSPSLKTGDIQSQNPVKAIFDFKSGQPVKQAGEPADNAPLAQTWEKNNESNPYRQRLTGLHATFIRRYGRGCYHHD
jgi:hypothetical protein